MTVPAATYPKRQTLTGAGQTIQIPFYFPEAQYLAVTLLHDDGTVTELESSDYTVTGAGQPAGGALTLGGSIGTSGDVCVIVLNIPVTQLLDFVYADGFRSEDIETVLDRMVSILRMFIAELNNAVRISIEEDTDAADTEIPAKAVRKGKVIYFDETTGELDMLTPDEVVTLGE